MALEGALVLVGGLYGPEKHWTTELPVWLSRAVLSYIPYAHTNPDHLHCMITMERETGGERVYNLLILDIDNNVNPSLLKRTYLQVYSKRKVIMLAIKINAMTSSIEGRRTKREKYIWLPLP